MARPRVEARWLHIPFALDQSEQILISLISVDIALRSAQWELDYGVKGDVGCVSVCALRLSCAQVSSLFLSPISSSGSHLYLSHILAFALAPSRAIYPSAFTPSSSKSSSTSYLPHAARPKNKNTLKLTSEKKKTL